MQIGISTASFFTKCQTEESLAFIAMLGAVRYEAFLGSYLEYEAAFIADLCMRQKELGLHCTALHALGSQFEPQLFSIVERQRSGAEYYFQKTLEGAARLGAPLYVMHGIFHLKKGMWIPDYARLGERFVALCDMAASFGVRLTLENVHWCMYAQSGLAQALAPYLKDCPLGYTLDVKQAVQSGDPVEDYLSDMGQRLCNVHLCDVSSQDGRIYTCLPGQGKVDFAALAQAVSRIDPLPSVTLEVYAPDYRSMEELHQSYAWLSELFLDCKSGGLVNERP